MFAYLNLRAYYNDLQTWQQGTFSESFILLPAEAGDYYYEQTKMISPIVEDALKELESARK